MSITPKEIQQLADQCFLGSLGENITARGKLVKLVGHDNAMALAQAYGLPTLHSRERGVRPADKDLFTELLSDTSADLKVKAAEKAANPPFQVRPNPVGPTKPLHSSISGSATNPWSAHVSNIDPKTGEYNASARARQQSLRSTNEAVATAIAKAAGCKSLDQTKPPAKATAAA